MTRRCIELMWAISRNRPRWPADRIERHARRLEWRMLQRQARYPAVTPLLPDVWRGTDVY